VARRKRRQHGLPQEVPWLVTRHRRQLGHRRPPAGALQLVRPYPVDRCQLGELGLGEPQIALHDPRDPTLRHQPRQRHRRTASPTGQHHMGVRRQRGDQRFEPPRPGRTDLQPVHVVEQDAHLRRGPPPQRVHHHRHRRAISPHRRRPHRGGHDVGQDPTAIAGLDPHPQVLALWPPSILGQSLRQRDRLPETRASNDHHHRHRPTPLHDVRQPRTTHQPRTQRRRSASEDPKHTSDHMVFCFAARAAKPEKWRKLGPSVAFTAP
jgi:hypothetical protein